MPATCCNVIISCIRDTPLWRMWIHGRVQNISIKTPFRPAVPLFPMEIMLSDALIISDQGTWTARQFCCGGGKCDTKKYWEIKISVNKPSWAIPTQSCQQWDTDIKTDGNLHKAVRYLAKEWRYLGEVRVHSVCAGLQNPVKLFTSVAYF